MVVYEGEYRHVNDPSVVIHDGVWYMVYTAFKVVGPEPRDWINYSTSNDGIQWTPAAGTAATEIVLADPNNLAGGPVTDIARPSLVRTPTRWEMWFDGQVNNGPLTSFLAHSTNSLPTNFTIVHRYSEIGGFPGFFEPDVVRRPDGSYLAVVQRHFRDLYFGTSTNGINFTFTADVSATATFFGRSRLSNPGLVYDQATDRLMGLSFGMTDSAELVDHDIGFSVSQYHTRLRSPGNVWHVFNLAGGQDRQSVLTFAYTAFDRIRITDPATGLVVLEQSVSNIQAGDVWHVQWNPEAPVIAPVLPAPDAVRARTQYVRQVQLLAGSSPLTWSLPEAPEGAQIDAAGLVSGWVPRHNDFGKLFAFTVQAENAAGGHSQRWQVEVLRGLPDFNGDNSVDQQDFGTVQACLGPVGTPQNAAACEGADLDYDGDVDVYDLARFLGCMTSPGLPINTSCLD